jgi:hypothetical protein
LDNHEAISEKRSAVRLGEILQHATSQLGIRFKPFFAARHCIQLKIVIGVTQVLVDVESRCEVSDQDRLPMNEAITNGTLFRSGLRHDWIVAGAGYLQARRNDERDIGSCPVSGVVVKRKPTGGIHQV